MSRGGDEKVKTLIAISDVILCFLNFVSFSLDKCYICIIIQYIKFLYIKI